MRFNDAVSGLAIILFAVAMIAYTTTFPPMPGQRYGPALFPRVIGGGLLLAGVILVARGWRERASVPWVTLGGWATQPRFVVNVVLVLAGLLGYILFSDWLGFIPTSLAILLVLFIRFGVSWFAAVPAAIVTTLVIHTIFARYLLVPLPWGLLQPIAW